MRDAERRAILVLYTETLRDGRQGLMKKTRYTKGRITQLFDPKEPFGERAAANLARRAKLPADFFERSSADMSGAPMSTLSVDERRQLLTAWEKMTVLQRQQKLEEIEVLASDNIDIAEHLHGLGLKIKHLPREPEAKTRARETEESTGKKPRKPK